MDYLIVQSFEINYNEINIYKFLESYKNKEIIYIPNPGNAGDSLIVYGTLQVFKDLNLKWVIGDINKTYENKLLVFGGGGNLVGIYKDCHNFLNNNKLNNKIILLPHTVKGEDKLLDSFNDNIIIMCREKKSYDYCYNIMKHKNNLYICDDMAFNIKNLEKYKDIATASECNCYRVDVEKTDIMIPKDNIDLSNFLNKYGNTTDIKIMEEISLSIFKYLSKYNIINTNRLHMAIAGSLIGKKVNFYPNIYYKNEAVYEYSIMNKFRNITFHK